MFRTSKHKKSTSRSCLFGVWPGTVSPFGSRRSRTELKWTRHPHNLFFIRNWKICENENINMRIKYSLGHLFIHSNEQTFIQSFQSQFDGWTYHPNPHSRPNSPNLFRTYRCRHLMKTNKWVASNCSFKLYDVKYWWNMILCSWLRFGNGFWISGC